MSREFVIKKLSHARERAFELLDAPEFRSETQMITAFESWFKIAPPNVRFCNVKECDALRIHAQRHSTGMKSSMWFDCVHCGEMCERHQCSHTRQERIGLRTFDLDEQRSFIRKRKPKTNSTVILEESINRLDRDVISVIHKHLVEAERLEIEKDVLESFRHFKTLEQMLFTWSFLLEYDITFDGCEKCDAFQMTLQNPSVSVMYKCKEIFIREVSNERVTLCESCIEV